MCLCVECCVRTAGRCSSGSSPSATLWCNETRGLAAVTGREKLRLSLCCFNSREKNNNSAARHLYRTILLPHTETLLPVFLGTAVETAVLRLANERITSPLSAEPTPLLPLSLYSGLCRAVGSGSAGTASLLINGPSVGQ